MTEDERPAMLDECFEYSDHLRANGHVVAEVPLQPPETAVTLYWKTAESRRPTAPMRKPRNSSAAVGGTHILEARDLNHVIQLISQHPGMKYGPLEIRPVADLSDEGEGAAATASYLDDVFRQLGAKAPARPATLVAHTHEWPSRSLTG